MDLVPGARFELDGGPSFEIVAPPRMAVPGLVALDVRSDAGTCIALAIDPHAEQPLRDDVERDFVRVRLREAGRFGPSWSGSIGRASREIGGYRDAAVGPQGGADRLLVFSAEPTRLLGGLLTPHMRVPWPPHVVAGIGVEIARFTQEGSVRRLDPGSVGLACEGVFVVDPALDALLRPVAPTSKGSSAWMGHLAPERIRTTAISSVPEDAAARHALGVLLHELLLGAALYQRETAFETIQAIRLGLPTPLTPRVPGPALDVAACIHALLDHDPLRRPDPRKVMERLEPHAAPDLAWCHPLLEGHARPFEVLGLVRRSRP